MRMVESTSMRRAALVTGGMGGIGRGVVTALIGRGFDVVVGDRTIDPAASNDLRARSLPEARLAFLEGDLADLEDHARFVDQAFGFFGPTCDSLDAMKGPFHLPADIKEGDWIEVGQLGSYGATMRTNFNGFGFGQTVEVADKPLVSIFGIN